MFKKSGPFRVQRFVSDTDTEAFTFVQRDERVMQGFADRFGPHGRATLLLSSQDLQDLQGGGVLMFGDGEYTTVIALEQSDEQS